VAGSYRHQQRPGKRTFWDSRIVPVDEIATAIARCAGCLADSVATEEIIYSGEGSTIHYDGATSQLFFDRRVSATMLRPVAEIANPNFV
jgi:hypothetical protein